MAEAAAAPPAPLTKQEVINLLDTIPTFNIVDSDNRIVGTPDEEGEICIRFWSDIDEANSALVLAQTLRGDSTTLSLACTPLGTSFAYAEGWQDTPATMPLKLHASRAVVAGVAEELGAEPDAAAFPIFCCDELSNSRVKPFFLSRQDLSDTWVSAGRSADALPKDLTVVLLTKLVNMMLTAHGGIDWRTAMFIASHRSTDKAQEIQEREAAARIVEDDPEAEPPPLE